MKRIPIFPFVFASSGIVNLYYSKKWGVEVANRGIKATKLSVGLPFGLGQLEFEPDEVQQYAAWELYVELTTRVALHPLRPEEGIIREALSSLYIIVDVTRKILREVGPSVAQGPNSLGPVAINVIVQGIRPFLSKWHPLLFEYEQDRPEEIDQLEHERAWEKAPQFYQELDNLHEQMLIYVEALAKIAGINIENENC